MSDEDSTFIISQKIRQKLTEKHNVQVHEIIECFSDRGNILEDTREEHRTEPPTLWFIGETNKGRRLKVVFVLLKGKVFIKTAYEPNMEEERIYAKYG